MVIHWCLYNKEIYVPYFEKQGPGPAFQLSLNCMNFHGHSYHNKGIDRLEAIEVSPHVVREVAFQNPRIFCL